MKNDRKTKNELIAELESVCRKVKKLEMLLKKSKHTEKDITERKRMEESLATERRFLRQVIDTVPAFICVKTEAGPYALANASLAKAYGTSVSGVEGKSDLDFSPTPEEAAAFRKDDLDVIHSRRTKTIAEEPITYEDGTVHWYSTTKIPVIDPDDSCSKVLVVAMDITEIREHREHLQELVERRTAELTASQAALVEAQAVAHTGSWKFDNIGDRITGSEEFYRLFDVAPKDLTRISQFVERLHPDDRERVQRDLSDALQQDRPYDTDYRVKLGDNSWRNINARGRIFTDTAGKTVSMMGTCLDITERKRAEEASVRLTALVESADDAIIGKDMKGIITSWNAGAEKLFGYSANESVGRSIMQIVPQDRLNEEVQVLDRIRRTVRAQHFETVRLTKDGQLINVSVTSSPIKDAAGNLVGVSKVVRDITERKQSEKALSEAELKFRTIFDKASDGILLAENGRSTFYIANNKICEMLGYAQEEIIKIGLSEIHLEKDLPYVIEQFERLRRNEISLAADIPVLRKDGSIFYADINASSVNLGGKDYLLGVFRDITDRKRAEEAERYSRKELDRLFEVSPEMISIIGFDGRFKRLNPAWEKALGYPIDTMLSTQFIEYVHPDDIEATNAEAAKLAIGERTIRFENRYRCTDGSYRWLAWSVIPVIEEKLLYAVARDITEHKMAEEEIRKLNTELEDRVVLRTAQLEASNKELEAFTYSVSHDLRAPLRHVSGYVELLTNRFQSTLAEKGLHYLDSIADSVHQMGLLIDDLLQFSRTGRAEMRRSDSDMNEIVQEVVKSLSKDNPDRTIEWTAGKLPSVVCDRSMLRLVWVNLLSNAVKFTRVREKALIEIGATVEAKEVIFFIRDNGVGFDMQYAQKLFGVFQRMHPTEEFEGTGIGLANVHRIVTRHGGRTWAEAELGKGATFYFSIPK
jgi:PAS domain S-box-containing protein